jgi:hypothetical protein
MHNDEFEVIATQQIARCLDVLGFKAGEYATEDRLHNFKIASRIQECTMRQALAGMLVKHTTSIYDMCKSLVESPIELWDEKITDHINYLILLRAVVQEESKTKKTRISQEKHTL